MTKKITAEEFDAKAEAGEDVTEYLDMTTARRPGMVTNLQWLYDAIAGRKNAIQLGLEVWGCADEIAAVLKLAAENKELKQQLSKGSSAAAHWYCEMAAENAKLTAVVDVARTFLHDFLHNKTCAPGALQRALAALDNSGGAK